MTGRPLARATSRIHASSDSTRGSAGPSPSKRGAHSTTPAAASAQHRRERDELVGSAQVPGTKRPSGTRWRSVRELENPSAPARDRLVDERAHRRELGRGRRLARLGGQAAVAHRVVADRAVADHARRR